MEALGACPVSSPLESVNLREPGTEAGLSQAAAEILRSIRASSAKEQEAQDLLRLAAEDPSRAAGIASALVDAGTAFAGRAIVGQENPDPLLEAGIGFQELLREARKNPPLRELFRPHLERILSVGPLAVERQDPQALNNSGGYWEAALLSLAWKLFPEAATPEALQRYAAPLLANERTGYDAAAYLAVDLWEIHPDLVPKTMDMALASGVGEAARCIFEEALFEKHWRPTPQQRDAILAGLDLAPAWGDQGAPTNQALQLLRVLKKDDPSALESLEIQGPSGNLMSAPKALLEGLLEHRPSSELDSVNPANLIVESVCGLVFPNSPLTLSLIEEVERAFSKAGSSPDGLPERAVAAAALLGNLSLGAPERRRLEAVLSPERVAGAPGWPWERLVRHLRTLDLEAQADTLPCLPPAEQPDRAAALLLQVRELYAPCFSSDLAAQSLQEHMRLEGAAEASIGALARRLREEVRATPLRNLSPETLAGLQVLDACPRWRDQLLEAMRPGLSQAQGLLGSTARHLWERCTWTESLADLRSPTATPNRLLEALDLAGLEQYHHNQVVAAWSEGLGARQESWLAELRERIEDPEAQMDVFRRLAGASPEQAESRWGRFREVLERVGRLEDAGPVWTAWEQYLGQGFERQEALRLALRSHAVGDGASTEQGPIERSATTVTIGGVVLPVQA